MPKWTEIADESLPNLDALSFLRLKSGHVMVGARVWVEDGWVWAQAYSPPYHDGSKWMCDSLEQDDDYEVTHWLYMPDLPDVQG